MFESLAVMVITTFVVLGVAVAVVVGLALIRRPASSWQAHLRQQNDQLKAERNQAQPRAEIDPTVTSLHSILEGSSQSRSAYFDADRLPGVDRIEVVTDRFESMHEKRQKTRS